MRMSRHVLTNPRLICVPLALGILCATISIQLYARQKGNRKPQVQMVPLPADYRIDLQLARLERQRMIGNNTVLVGTPTAQAAQEVFARLIGRQTVSSMGLPYPWRLTLVDNGLVNAESTPGGQVYAFSGLAQLIGQHKGLWAAVLSHEIMHTALRHQVRDALERAYILRQIQNYKWEVARGEKAASWALAGFEIAAPLVLKKMERDQEHQADTQGMMLMARAGYHPDFVFALHHLLESEGGDQSKFAAFFADHPRWATRDQRSQKVYSNALETYQSLWPNAAISPGGIPPTVVFLGHPTTTEDKQDKSATISLPLSCRNAQLPVIVLVTLTNHGVPVKSRNARFSDAQGDAVIWRKITCPASGDQATVQISILRKALVLRKNRKLKARLTMLDPSGNFLGPSVSVEIRMPK